MPEKQADRPDLVELIARVVADSNEWDQLKTYNPQSSYYRTARLQFVSGVSDDALEHLGRELAAYFDWGFDDHIYFMVSPGSGGSFQFRIIAQQIVARARVVGAESALTAYEHFFESNHTEVQEVVVIWGVHPKQRFEIHDGIYLQPLDSVSPSQPRDLLLEIPVNANYRGEPGGFHVRARPKAALTYDFVFSPVVSRTPMSSPATNGRNMEMLEIARCLTLISPRKVEHIGSWFQCDHELPIVGGAGGWGGQEIRWSHQFLIEPEDLDIDRLRTIVRGYFSLPKSDRERLKIIIGRLNSAKSNDDLTDRAIDLGICLEALLFNPKDSHSEISFKFKMRGSVLMSDDTALRKETFSLLDRIYTYRSTAAHGAVFKPQSSGEVSKDLDAGAELASKLIQRVLILGRIPQSWNGLILGWEQFSLPE